MASALQSSMHPLQTAKIVLKDTTNVYLENALIRIRTFGTSLKTVKKREWIINSGNGHIVIMQPNLFTRQSGADAPLR